MRRRIFTLASLLSLMLCVATVVLWVRSYHIGSGFHWVRSFKDSSGRSRDVEWFLACGGGRVYFERYITPFPLPVERLGFGYVQYQWYSNQAWFDVIDSQDRYEVLFPVAVPVGLTLILPLWWVYLRLPKPVRPGPNCCRACSYNLTGNTSGTCPECGSAVKAS